VPSHPYPLCLRTAHLGTLFLGTPVYTHVVVPLFAYTRILYTDRMAIFSGGSCFFLPFIHSFIEKGDAILH